MELVSVRVVEAPSTSGRVRLVGDVVYDDRAGAVEQYWFETPEKYADSLSLSGNPWLACLLPLAVTRGEPLRLCLPIDPVLAANAARLMEIWKGWNPDLQIVPIEAERESQPPSRGPAETGALFSGGVDSFFTVLRNAEERDRAASPAIDRLLHVWGFDIPLAKPEEFARLRSRLAEAAAELGKELIDVATNLRDVRFREAHWGRLSHGCALASIGLALERRFHSVYIAATYSGGAPIRPWGSHPETDPLLSTSATRIIHDGAGIGRSEKTAYISRFDTAMRSLHVCFRSLSADNCCVCRKCYLTMLTLEVMGALTRCSAFRSHELDLHRIQRIHVRGPVYEYLFRDIELRARAAGRRDIAHAIARALRRYRRLKPLLTALQWLSTKRGVWRIARRVRIALLADSPR